MNLIKATTITAGVDLDGVNYRFVGMLREWLLMNGWKKEQLPDACCWEFPVNHWGMTWSTFGEQVNAATDAGFLFAQGDPYEHAIESCWRLHDAGIKLAVATDRDWGTDQRAHRNTREWLEMVGFPPHELTFTADKRSVDADYFVEDRDKNFYQLVEAGTTTFLVDQAYNRHVETKNRIADLRGYANAILAAA